MPKKTTATTTKRLAGRALTPARMGGNPLEGLTIAGGAIAKLPGASASSVEREKGVVLVRDTPYIAGAITVPAEEVYFDPDVKPGAKGEWLGEADKVSWRDPATGYECIMLRSTRGGFLSGYVGVPTGHPLHGFDHAAIPAELGVEIHGGLTYSAICQGGPTPERRILAESRRICHVPRDVRYAATAHATDHRVHDQHAWWFGFHCDHLHDVIPDDPAGTRRHLGPETGATYRDDEYVCQEITNLAGQLRAIADGTPMPPRAGPPLPPAALDSRQRG